MKGEILDMCVGYSQSGKCLPVVDIGCKLEL